MRIGDYELTSPFVTAGSGNARWCVALRDGKRYFLKQFLAPVQPVQTTEIPADHITLRRERCAAFERRKQALHSALKQINGNCIVRVDDFFVHDGHYFTVSEYIDPSHPTLEAYRTTRQTALQIVIQLAECLHRLHKRGVVHADLKPEHIVVYDGLPIRTRLIDFDSGFLESSPPDRQTGIEIDPVYLSPEAFLLITGKPAKLNRRIDTFSFGILVHQTLTGELPGYDKTKYAYLYACVLDGGEISLSQTLTGQQQALIRRMLRKNPALRPGDRTIVRELKASLSSS